MPLAHFNGARIWTRVVRKDQSLHCQSLGESKRFCTGEPLGPVHTEILATVLAMQKMGGK